MHELDVGRPVSPRSFFRPWLREHDLGLGRGKVVVNIITVQRCHLILMKETNRCPRIGRRALQAVVDAALVEAGIDSCSLTVMFVDAQTSAELHQRHFAQEDATDVMTFPDGSRDPGAGELHLGDLAVCVDVALVEAKRRRRSASHELTLYILHGLLHLLGYDDTTPAKRKRMWRTQHRLLAMVDIAVEPSPS